MLLSWEIQLVLDKTDLLCCVQCVDTQVKCGFLGNTDYKLINLPRADTSADDKIYIT